MLSFNWSIAPKYLSQLLFLFWVGKPIHQKGYVRIAKVFPLRRRRQEFQVYIRQVGTPEKEHMDYIEYMMSTRDDGVGGVRRARQYSPTCT